MKKESAYYLSALTYGDEEHQIFHRSIKDSINKEFEKFRTNLPKHLNFDFGYLQNFVFTALKLMLENAIDFTLYKSKQCNENLLNFLDDSNLK